MHVMKMKILQKFYRTLLLLLAVGAGFAFFCSAPEEDPALAVFDGGSVRQSEYIEHYLGSTRYKPNEMPGKDNLVKIVTRRAMEKMGVMEAVARGIDKDSLYVLSVDKNKRTTYFHKYMRMEIINKVINDSLIRAFYADFTPQYKMSYIIRPVVKSSTPEFARAQKDTIELVYRLLQAGESFADAAGEHEFIWVPQTSDLVIQFAADREGVAAMDVGVVDGGSLDWSRYDDLPVQPGTVISVVRDRKGQSAQVAQPDGQVQVLEPTYSERVMGRVPGGFEPLWGLLGASCCGLLVLGAGTMITGVAVRKRGVGRGLLYFLIPLTLGLAVLTAILAVLAAGAS